MSAETGPISPARLRLLIQLALGSGADISLANPLPVTFGALVPGVDVSDRAARLLGIVYGNLAQIQQLAALVDGAAPVNLLSTGAFPHIFNGLTWDMAREGNVAGSGLSDVTDRAARLLGVVYGSQAAQLQQVAGTLELITQDTGLNTNPERWLHDNHWEADEVSIVAAGVGGEQALGAAVGVGLVRRIRELTIRNPRQDNVVITLLVSGGATKVTIDVPAQSTRVWSSQDGRAFDPAEVSAVQSSAAAAAPNNVLVSASGVEQ